MSNSSLSSKASELADHKIDSPKDVVKPGDQVEVKILKVDTDSRKIGLSLRRAQWAAEEQTAEKSEQEKAAAVQTVLSNENLIAYVASESEKIGSEEKQKDQPQDTAQQDDTTETAEETGQEQTQEAVAEETEQPADEEKSV